MRRIKTYKKWSIWRLTAAEANIPVCPFWQRRAQEKGDEDGKPQEGICAAVL